MQSVVDTRIINAIQAFLGRTKIDGSEASLMVACQQMLQGLSSGAFVVVSAKPEAPLGMPLPRSVATNGDGSHATD